MSRTIVFPFLVLLLLPLVAGDAVSDILSGISEGGKVMDGNARADFAIFGRRKVLQDKGMDEEDIEEEIALLEEKIKHWRKQKAVLPADLAPYLTKDDPSDISTLTYGELESLIKKLNERASANYGMKLSPNATEEEMDREREQYKNEKLDERELARQHGYKDKDIPEMSLHDLHVKGQMEGEIGDASLNRDPDEVRFRSKVGKPKTNPEISKLNYRTHRDVREMREKEEKEQKMAQGGAEERNDVERCLECDATLAAEIEMAKEQGVDVQFGTFTKEDMERQVFEAVDRVKQMKAEQEGEDVEFDVHVEL